MDDDPELWSDQTLADRIRKHLRRGPTSLKNVRAFGGMMDEAIERERAKGGVGTRAEIWERLLARYQPESPASSLSPPMSANAAARIESDVESVVSSPVRELRSVNIGQIYDRLSDDRSSDPRYRWVGACRGCGAAHQLNGRIAMGHVKGRSDYVVVADDGALYTSALHGTDPTLDDVRCGDRWCRLRRVFDDAKPNKPRSACGARCINATGPACDCRCRGANHGSGL